MHYLCNKNKGADQLAVTVQLICAFVFAYAKKNQFSHDPAQIALRFIIRSVLFFGADFVMKTFLWSFFLFPYINSRKNTVTVIIPPAYEVCRGYIVFAFSIQMLVCVCVC